MRRLFLMLFIAAACAGICRAQDSSGVLIGMVAGYGAGQQFGAVPIFGGALDSECGDFTSGSSRSFGIGVRYIDPSFFSPQLGLSFDLISVSHSGALVASPHDPLLIFEQETGEASEIGHEFRYNMETQTIQIEPAAYLSALGWLSFRGGVWVGYRTSGRLTQIDTIISGDQVFSPAPGGGAGSRQRTMNEGANLTLAPFAYGMVVGGSARLPVSRQVSLRPELFLRADLGSFATEYRWQDLTGGISLAVLFNALPVPAEPRIVETPPADPPRRDPPATSRFTASVDLYGTDEAERRLPAATIRVFEAHRRVRTGWLERIMFERGSSSIAPRYAELSAAEKERFDADSLRAPSPAELHRQVLNVLGQRMQRNPQASIALRGFSTNGERRELGRLRAESVRRYLRDVWGIDTSRISIVDRGEGGKAFTGVTVTTGTQAIVEPVVAERIEPDFDPPLIVLDPVIEAEAGVKEWRIILSHDGQEIGRYGSLDSAGEDFPLDWTIVDGGSKQDRSTLMAELTVEDSLGRTLTSRSQTPLAIERQSRIADRWEMPDGKGEGMFFTFYPFAAGSADITPRNQEVAGEIAAKVRSGARVMVIENGQGELARRRAAALAETLRAALAGRGARVTVVTEAAAQIDDDVALLLEMSGSRGGRVLVEQEQ